MEAVRQQQSQPQPEAPPAAWRSLGQARKISAASVAGRRGFGLWLRLLLPYHLYYWLQTLKRRFMARNTLQLETIDETGPV